MLLKQKLKLILILILTVNYSEALKRDYEKENEIFINKLFSIRQIIVDEQAEKSNDSIWNSFPQEVCQLLFVSKGDKEALIIEEKSGQKSVHIGAIIDYVEQSFTQGRMRGHLKEKNSKKINSLPEAFAEMDKLIFSTKMSINIKNKTINVIDKVIKFRTELNEKIKEIKSRFLTGLNSEDFKNLEKILEKNKKDTGKNVKNLDYNFKLYETNYKEEIVKKEELYEKNFYKLWKINELKTELENFKTDVYNQIKNISEIVENYKKEYKHFLNAIEILKKMKDLLKEISHSEYNVSHNLDKNVVKKIAKLYVLGSEIIPDYLEKFKEHKFKEEQQKLEKEVDIIGKKLLDCVKEEIDPSSSMIVTKPENAKEFKVTDKKKDFLNLKEKVIDIINETLQAYDILNNHYNFSNFITNHLEYNYHNHLKNARHEFEAIKLKQD